MSQVATVLAWLERTGDPNVRAGLARYGLPTDKAFGIPMGVLQKYAKSLGKDHDLACALWDTGWYDARLMTAYLAVPAQVTPALMDRWAKEFDNWGVCDTLCFALFDRTPHAWGKVRQWAKRRDEFVKRAAFALLASLTVHDKNADDGLYADALPLIEAAATDERNFVKKSVNWALRSIGKRSRVLHTAAVALAEKLAGQEDRSARWVGKDALRELRNASVARRLAKKD